MFPKTPSPSTRASAYPQPEIVEYLDAAWGDGPVWFISDLHLSPRQTALTQLFRDFCRAKAQGARAVFILGDLFDYWVHRDQAQEPIYAEVFTLLQQLAASGTAIYLMVGNRDFALDKNLLRSFAIRPLADPAVLHLGTQRVLLTHGDLLCTDDRRYQLFRRMIRHPLTRLTLGNLPYAWLQKLAGQLRRSSHQAVQKKAPTITDAHPDAIHRALAGSIGASHQEPAFAILIHGHTHRPLWEERTNGRRMVLGAWTPQGAAIGRWQAGIWSLETLSYPL